MSLGNREDKASNEAEPEELPDIGPFKQPAMYRIALSLGYVRLAVTVRQDAFILAAIFA